MSSAYPSYTYAAQVVRVIDGDTVLMDVDLGFYVIVRMSCRLAGINARELNEPGGAEARAHLMGMLPVGAETVVTSVKADKYAGRFDGVLSYQGIDLGERMVADGYAAVWDGRGPQPVPPWPIPTG